MHESRRPEAGRRARCSLRKHREGRDIAKAVPGAECDVCEKRAAGGGQFAVAQ